MKKLLTVLSLVMVLTACEKSESSGNPKISAEGAQIITERLHKTSEQDSVDMELYRNYLSIGFPESLTESIKFMIDDIKKRDLLPDTISQGLVCWDYSKMYGGMYYCENNGKPFILSITYYAGERYTYISDIGADSFNGASTSEVFSSPDNEWSADRPPYTKEEILMMNKRYKEVLLNVYAEFNYPE